MDIINYSLYSAVASTISYLNMIPRRKEINDYLTEGLFTLFKD